MDWTMEDLPKIKACPVVIIWPGSHSTDLEPQSSIHLQLFKNILNLRSRPCHHTLACVPVILFSWSPELPVIGSSVYPHPALITQHHYWFCFVFLFMVLLHTPSAIYDYFFYYMCTHSLPPYRVSPVAFGEEMRLVLCGGPPLAS